MISTATNTVTATITVGSDPCGVAVTPNGEYAYVTNGAARFGLGDKHGYEYGDGDDNRWKRSCGVAVTPNGAYAYVTNSGSNTVSVISTATNTVTATITVGSDPYGVAVTPNGEYAYVTNDRQRFGFGDKHGYEHGDGDGNRWKSMPYGVAVTPNGAYAYVANVRQRFGLGDKHGYEYGDGDDNRWKRSLWCGCNAQRRIRLCYKSDGGDSVSVISTATPTSSPTATPTISPTSTIPEFPTWIIHYF